MCCTRDGHTHQHRRTCHHREVRCDNCCSDISHAMPTSTSSMIISLGTLTQENERDIAIFWMMAVLSGSLVAGVTTKPSKLQQPVHRMDQHPTGKIALRFSPHALRQLTPSAVRGDKTHERLYTPAEIKVPVRQVPTTPEEQAEAQANTRCVVCVIYLSRFTVPCVFGRIHNRACVACCRSL
mgnify:CR=1 FL=1